jgi:CheY-like chemotaxis protein
MQIMWIDDDVVNSDAQQEFLTECGFIVEVIDNVDDAWARLSSKKDLPDGIILDIMMGTGDLLKGEPTKGGLTTGQHFLMKMESAGMLDKIKVIIYTIVADTDAKAEVDRLGVKYYRKQSHPGRRLVNIAISEFGEP